MLQIAEGGGIEDYLIRQFLLFLCEIYLPDHLAMFSRLMDLPAVLLHKLPAFVLIIWHIASGDGGGTHRYKPLYINSIDKAYAVSPRRRPSSFTGSARAAPCRPTSTCRQADTFISMGRMGPSKSASGGDQRNAGARLRHARGPEAPPFARD